MKTGRPTKYSKETLKQAEAYYYSYYKAEPLITIEIEVKNLKGDLVLKDKVIDNHLFHFPPYIEELALQLDVDADTIGNWAKEHKEFFGTIKKIKTLQKMRLLHKTMDRSSTTGAIFQLKVNHEMIETEKKRIDITTKGKPIPILGGLSVQGNDSTKEDIETD